MSDENVGMSGLTASEAGEFMRSYEKACGRLGLSQARLTLLYGSGSPGSECNPRLSP